MSSLVGCMLVPTTKNPDTGLWFIFHHEEDGILAFDLTREHPDVPYRHFESVLDSEDRKPDRDKIVLRGGPLQDDSAMIVLHNSLDAGDDNHRISDELLFQSYKYIVIPGQPPSLAKSDETPTRITLGASADFIVSIGFRLWEMDTLEEELKNWQWTILPATPDLIFRTSHADRLQKARLSIN